MSNQFDSLQLTLESNKKEDSEQSLLGQECKTKLKYEVRFTLYRQLNTMHKYTLIKTKLQTKR